MQGQVEEVLSSMYIANDTGSGGVGTQSSVNKIGTALSEGLMATDFAFRALQKEIWPGPQNVIHCLT